MTSPLAIDAAASLYDEQARIVRAAVAATLDVWGHVDRTRFSASWVQDQIGDQLFLSLARAQELAAVAADAYTDVLLLEQGIEVTPDGDLVPSSLSGIASDGRPLDSLLLQTVIQSTVQASGGATLQDAWSAGAQLLTRIAGTQTADAGRAAMGLGIAARPRTGYVRLVEPKACSRCVILAGRYYRWSSGFLRHPLCKCRNIPASEDTAALAAESDPLVHFNSLSEAEQNKQFTKAGASAIRDGADIGRVVNARRGALGLNAPGALTRDDRSVVLKGGTLTRTDVAGRKVYVTSDGTTIRADYGKAEIERGNARVRKSAGGQNLTVSTTPRLMPESIYEIATDREDAIRLLKRFGYIAERNPLVDAQNASAAQARATFAAHKAAQGR